MAAADVELSVKVLSLNSLMSHFNTQKLTLASIALALHRVVVGAEKVAQL